MRRWKILSVLLWINFLFSPNIFNCHSEKEKEKEGGHVSGYIKDNLGNPVSGMNLTISVDIITLGCSSGYRDSLATTTDSSGFYKVEIEDITKRYEGDKTVEITVVAGGYGFEPISRELELEFTDTINGVNFTAIPRIEILGSVLAANGGYAVHEVEVILSGDAGANTITDYSGNFKFENLLPGTYTVTPNLPDASPPSYTFVVAEYTPQTHIADFTASFYAISGAISTPAGIPVRGVPVTLSGTWSRHAPVVTNSLGEFTFYRVSNGSYSITPEPLCAGLNYTPAQLNVLVSGASLMNQNLSLPDQPLSISGTVTSGGAPLANAGISIMDPGSLPVSSDLNGNYTINNLQAGMEYRVTAQLADY